MDNNAPHGWVRVQGEADALNSHQSRSLQYRGEKMLESTGTHFGHKRMCVAQHSNSLADGT
jgi:hypothetical protein